MKRFLFFAALMLLVTFPVVAGQGSAEDSWSDYLLYALPIVGAALAADRITELKERGIKSYPVKDATKIYAGSLVAIQVDGHAVPSSDTADLKVVGVAEETVDNSAGADGDKSIKVRAPIVARFDATSITQAMLGRVMYVVDDHTFDEAVGVNAIKAGRLVEYISAVEGWIQIEEAGEGVTNADAGGAYTAAEQALINAIKRVLNQRILG